MSTDLETRLRELPDRLAGLHAERDLAAAVRARHRQHRRLWVTTAAVAVAALLVGTMVAVGSGRGRTLPPAAPTPAATASPPRGPAPTDQRLLHWPTRGPLAGDTGERGAVLRDLETFARGDLSTYLNLRLRPPSEAPTHVLWLGPAYPEPLPVRLGPVAVVQQWNGEPVLLVLEKRVGHYHLLGEGLGRYGRPATARHLDLLWMPWECSWPTVSCPRRFAGLLLAAPGTERIQLGSVPAEYPLNTDKADWQDLPTDDGYAVLTVSPDILKVDRMLERIDLVRIDGVLTSRALWSSDGSMKP
jgi:hypothetical protein